jgi:hypothetical protein
VSRFGDDQHARLRGLAAAGEHGQARFDFLQRERLDQVIVGARIETGQFVVERIARGQHQHRRLFAALGAQLAADFQPVHAGQVEVEHDGVEIVDDRQVQAGDSVGGIVHGVAAVLEIVTEVGGDIAVVFDDEDAHGRGEFLVLDFDSARAWQVEGSRLDRCCRAAFATTKRTREDAIG